MKADALDPLSQLLANFSLEDTQAILEYNLERMAQAAMGQPMGSARARVTATLIGLETALREGQRGLATMQPDYKEDDIRAAIQTIIDMTPDLGELKIQDFTYKPAGWDADKRKLLRDHWVIHLHNGFRLVEYIMPHDMIIGTFRRDPVVLSKLQAIADEQKKDVEQRKKTLDADMGGLDRFTIERE